MNHNNNKEKDLLLNLKNQLNVWITQEEKKAELFEKKGMDIAAMGSNALAQAYWNVKQYIDVNENNLS